MTPYFVTETLSVMTVQILWILLTSIEVVHLEQLVFVPSAAELSDVPPENKQEWLHPVIFEPQNKIQLTHSTYQVTTFLDFVLIWVLHPYWMSRIWKPLCSQLIVNKCPMHA